MDSITDKIMEAYKQYRQNILDSYMNIKNLKIVIIMKPETFIKLKAENEIIYNFDNMYFAYICGRKTPIIVDNMLPKETEFIIQSQTEYERQEQNKLYEKFNKMFGI